MKTITLEDLLEAGCHFGHQVTRQNPKARDYVFEARDGIHIIDLEKTKAGLESAAEYLKDVATKGGSVIFVGAKRQARTIVEDEVRRARLELAELAEKSHGQAAEKQPEIALPKASEDETGGLHYVTNRWIGGILTNFPEITKNIKKLKEINTRLQSEEAKQGFTKKEIGLWVKERAKLESLYAGIIDLKKTPEAVFIVDTHLEDLVVREATRMNVKTVGITDTNADPYVIDYPIPANDDAVGSIKLILTYLINSWIEGKTEKKNHESGSMNQEKKETMNQKTVKSSRKKILKENTEEQPKKRVRKKKATK